MSLTSDYSDGVPTVSFHLTDMSGVVLAERNADVTFYSASTIKLGVLVAAMQAVERGELALDQPVISTHTFPSGVGAGTPFSFDPDDYDEGLPPEGIPTTLHTVLERMIIVSSNEATNLAIELVGFAAINASLAACGATNSFMDRLYGDMDALAAGLTHQVTARDLVKIMHTVLSGRAAGPELTAIMMGWLRAQEYPVIGLEAQALVPECDWGSKSGWVTGIRHDVAFVAPASEAPAAGEAPSEGYILAVCTRGYAEDDATEVVRSLAAMAHTIVTAQLN
ncbi:hypothetical protein MB46_01625 [Arthrobacter alpinus]|uniref:serine hydrolase n=1 Tax=Arthrobacter alpinus TaxID=656366 RepID=UPI0005CA897E|nr:serine hydrolase [Arthrobacter alpinus]ALV44412.1 hypothetical protein MB46_01625 [Arthrobacter alpinus]